MEFKQQIDVIVENFDFQALMLYVKIMNTPNVGRNVSHKIGTPEEARKLAKMMLEKVSQVKEDSIISQDGLEAEKIKSHLELRFVPLRSNTLSVMHE